MHKLLLRPGFWLLVWGCCCQACRVPQKGPSKEAQLVQPLAFEYLKLGTTIGYQDNAHPYSSAYVNFRIKKDHCIWFTVRSLGLEVFRGMLTPTGITLLNHLQKTYYVYDYTTLQAFWPGPWDYALVQALLLGEVAQAYSAPTLIQHNAQQPVLQQQEAAWTLTYLVNAALRKVEKLVATARQGRVVAAYKQFKPCQGGLLFRQATLHWYTCTASTQPALTVTLEGMQATWAKKPLRFPFSIPQHYEKK